jgi:hypothetical protein
MTKIALKNIADLHARRKALAAAAEQAAIDVQEAQARWADNVTEIAATGAGPHGRARSAVGNSSILAAELDAAKAEHEAAAQALRMVDAELAPYQTADRLKQANAAKERFMARFDEHLDAMEELQTLVEGPLRQAIERVFATKGAAAAEIGAANFGILDDMAGDPGLKARIGQRLGAALSGLVSGEHVAWGIHHREEQRCWRDQELLTLRIDTKALERLA